MSDLTTLETRRRRLLVLQVEVDQELAATEAALRVWTPHPGRPRVPYTMTSDEARAMHQRYNRGERGEDIARGEREYKRRTSRQHRARVSARVERENPQENKGNERDVPAEKSPVMLPRTIGG